MTGTTVPGRRIVVADVAGTAVFAVTAEISAVTFALWAQWLAALVALALFAAGVATFLLAHAMAVQRSRAEQIGVLEIFLLLGPSIPRPVRRSLLGILGLQVAVAVVTTFQRPNGVDGKPGTSLALGFLVPMFGLGLNGLWAATRGAFPPRRDRVARTEPAGADGADDRPHAGGSYLGVVDGEPTRRAEVSE